MKEYGLAELDEQYDLELSRVVAAVNKKQAKLVVIQFPDGLKQYAAAVVRYLTKETKATYLIWLGSCWGACDYPVGFEAMPQKPDMIVQFGHSDLMPSY